MVFLKFKNDVGHINKIAVGLVTTHGFSKV